MRLFVTIEMINFRERLALLWPKIEPHVKAALDVFPGYYEPVDILVYALDGKMTVWIVSEGEDIKAAIVTRLVDFPRRRVCDVPFIGGRDMNSWIGPVSDALEAYARENGCKTMHGGSRRGWIRAAGYTESERLLVKEL